MAARLKPRHQEDIRNKIQGIQLQRMLEEHALTGTFNGVEVSSTRIDAAKFLLNKLVSNAPTEIDQNITGSLDITKIERVVIDNA